MKLQLFIAAVIGLFSLGTYANTAFAQTLEVSPSSEASRQIVLSPIKRQAIPDKIAATATIEPDAGAVAEITSTIPARVVKLVAQPGQQVKAGEPLVVLGSVELGEAKTDYLKAKSLEHITGQNLAREQNLYQKKISPLKDLLDAQAQHDIALAQFESVREKLRLLIPAKEISSLKWSGNGRPLGEFTLSSPLDGTLVTRNLTIGAMVNRDVHPLKVINLSRVWIFANIFESELASLRVGDEASVTVDAYPGRIFTGRVAYIGDEVDRITRSVRARIDVASPDRLLKPGMFAQAEIAVASARDVIVAPDSALFNVKGNTVAFVATGPNTYSARWLRLGMRGSDTVQVISGLHDGDQVVSRGGLTLKTMLANNF